MTGVTNGVLYPYLKNIAVYQCPDAVLKNHVAQQRTVSMINRMGGADADDSSRYGVWNTAGSDLQPGFGTAYPMFKKLVQIRGPSPGEAIVFADESQITIDDCILGLDWSDWRNSPTARHNRGCVFSFADGHAERWQWAGVSAEQGYDVVPQNAAQQRDLQRFINAVVSGGPVP